MAIEISNRTELENIALDRAAAYLVAAPIDLSGAPWVTPCPDYDTRFQGSLDGDFYEISGLHGDPLIGYSRDGDGTINVVVSDAAGRVRAFRTGSVTPERRAPWPMDGGTTGREGIPALAGFRTGPNQVIVAVTAALVLGLAVLNVLVALGRRKKRRRLEELSARQG